MVQDLRALLEDCAGDAPHDTDDLPVVLRRGRRTRRLRAAGVATGAAAAVAVVAVVAGGGLPGASRTDGAPAGRPIPSGPVLHLGDSTRAVEGRDYREVLSLRNENLDRENGRYLVGVTADGLVLVQDGPRGFGNRERYGLLDPATSTYDWLPALPGDLSLSGALDLGRDRLLLTAQLPGDSGDPEASRAEVVTFDRGERRWGTISWPGLTSSGAQQPLLGPDGRLYVTSPATVGGVPEGGWPVDSSGEAEDADAEGDTYHLWSASLTDPGDVRDEGLTVGSVAFTDDAMVWTDATNGHAGRVHVRDLASGEEHSFDPHAGERCNLLGFGASGDRIVMSQYCGTYDAAGGGAVRDDRVQVVSTDGGQVVTVQGDDLRGGLASAGPGGGLVAVSSYAQGEVGTYVYDLASNTLQRVSSSLSHFAGASGGPLPTGYLQWSTAANRGHGEDEHLAVWTR